jgi:hypothetical protein
VLAIAPGSQRKRVGAPMATRRREPYIPAWVVKHAMVILFGLALILLAMTETRAQVVIDERADDELIIKSVELGTVAPRCQVYYCDGNDRDCDGVLDQVCVGLEYDICRFGSVVYAFMRASYSGFCDGSRPLECTETGLIVSPSNCRPGG